MPISSLVITLAPAPQGAEEALRYLNAQTDLTIGVADGSRVPVVLESSTLSQSADRVRALQQAPGVVFVDVVEVHFEDLSTPVMHRRQA